MEKNQISNDTLDAGPNTIIVQDFVYTPSNLFTAPGSSINVVNRDMEAHSVTSESTPGSYSLGAVDGIQFDTGVIQSNQSATFSVPFDAPLGTVIHYFCTVHKSSMVEGSLTVR